MAIINRLTTDKKGFESGDIYIKEAVAYWSVVYEPKTKLKTNDKEYSIILFVDDETRKELEEDLLLNKTFFTVGVEKNKFKKIKFPTSKQVGEDDFNYDEVEGLSGAQFTCPEFTKKGGKNKITVVDNEGKPFSEDIGNGSRVMVKLFGYRNQEGMLNVQLKAVKVIEHVPYTSGGGGAAFDDVMGCAMDVPTKDEPKDEFDDVPFDTDDDADLY
jgi:hypothetical protein